jgi:hypothetical protein
MSPHTRPKAFAKIVCHSGGTDALNALFGNPEFVLANAGAGMLSSAINDYELSEDAELHTVRDALILSSHVATSRIEELPAQLRGRLCGFADGMLVEFVRRIEPLRGSTYAYRGQ